MTSEEFRALEREANDVIEKITKEFKKRIKELYAIAIESGHGTKFGWLEEPLEWPDERDFETEDEYEDADDRYAEFRDCAIGFVYMDDHNFTIFDGYSFEIDEDGNVTFTSVMAIEDVEDKEFFEDTHYGFYPHLADNWRACGRIIEQIERELGIE